MDFLDVRERYKIAFHQWDRSQEQLCQRLGCTFATLEQKLLEARNDPRHAAAIADYGRLSAALDQASSAWDTAQVFLARRQLDKDLALIDC